MSTSVPGVTLASEYRSTFVCVYTGSTVGVGTSDSWLMDGLSLTTSPESESTRIQLSFTFSRSAA